MGIGASNAEAVDRYTAKPIFWPRRRLCGNFESVFVPFDCKARERGHVSQVSSF